MKTFKYLVNGLDKTIFQRNFKSREKEKSVLFSEWYRMGFSPGKTGGSQSAGLYTGAGIGCEQSLF